MKSAVFRSIGRLQESRDWRLGPQTHPFHEMIIVVSGSQTTQIEDCTVSAASGEALLYPAGIPHVEWRTGNRPLETLFMAFNWSRLPTDAPRLFNDERGRLQVMAEWLLAEREMRSRSSPAVNHAILQSMLTECAALWEHRNEDIVSRLRMYTEKHISEPFSLADLSQALGFSRYHLVRTYRALTGHTPMADVTRLRLDRARDLILTTSAPLKEIAPRVGLTDVYRMCRLFRRHLGITPGSLRRRSEP